MKEIAATIAFAFLLHVVFSSVGSDFDLAVIYWLLYALACGTIINHQGGAPHWRLLLSSIPSPLVLVAVTYYRALYMGVDNCWISGLKCELDATFGVKTAGFLAGSLLFIWIFSYLSAWSISLTVLAFRLTPKRAKQIRNRIVWVGSLVVAIAGVVTIVAHGWRR